MIVLVDSVLYSTNSFVAAPPTGTNHILCWNAATNFSSGSSNNVLLRARATDITTNGGWSQPVAYRVEIPLGPISPPRLTALPLGLDGSFQGMVEGAVGHYTIEASTNLMDWTVVTRVLSTSLKTNFRDLDATNFNRRFYRVVVP